MTKRPVFAIPLLALSLLSPSVFAGNFSFTGTFTEDNAVQFFNFSIAADSTVVKIKTFSLNGGTNSAGAPIASGGFDPYLALFNQADGAWVYDTSPKYTGNDALIEDYGTLLAGNYILALTQFDNTVAGLNLSDGFAYASGLTNFDPTPFTTNGGGGSGHWAVDILNVDKASLPSSVPEPASGLLLVLGLASAVGLSRNLGYAVRSKTLENT